MRNLRILFLAAVTILFASCLDQPAPRVNTGGASSSQSGNAITVPTPCGTPQSQTFFAGQHTDAGTIEVFNDQTNLYVTFNTTGGWEMGVTHLYVGDCATIPTNGGGNPQIGQFPSQTNHSPMVTSYTYVYTLADLDQCFCVAAHAEVHLVDANGNTTQSETAWGDGTPFTTSGGSWATYSNYCVQPCSITPPPPTNCALDTGDFRTQTQGGWGANPQGHNPGTYLHAYFAAAFPNGLTIGCNETVSYTSAQAITDYLPSGGPAKVLTSSYTDPGNQPKNILVSQLTAASLSVGFDAYDPNFGAATTSLGDMVLNTGNLQGMSVNQIIAEANQLLGGCSSNYTASDLADALAMINEEYVDGTMIGGNLDCP